MLKLCIGSSIQGEVFRVQGVKFRVHSSELRVQCLGLRALGFRVMDVRASGV